MSKNYFTEIAGYKLKDSELRDEIGAVKEEIGFNDIYGFECDFENYTVRRLCAAVGKSGGADFNNTQVWGRMRRCTVADDGTVTSYYGDNNYVEDGSIGQVMVEIPKFFYLMKPLKLVAQSWDDYGATAWVSGTSYAVGKVVIYDESYYACITANSDVEFTPAKWHEITELGLMGYHIYKARWYVSHKKYGKMKVHPAFIDKTTGNLRDYVYIGAYGGIAYDVSESKYMLNDEQDINETATTGDKLSSIGGTYERSYTYYDKTTDTNVTITVNAGAKPCSGRTSANNLTRHNCTVLAENRGSGWEQQTIEIVSAIQLLCAIEYCSFNWQAIFGEGVVRIADDGVYNCSSFMSSTSGLGNSSGSATSTIDYTGTSRTTSGTLSFSYRGIEDFFGNIWKWVEGINIYGEYDNGGGQPFFCTDVVYTEDVHANNYVGVGFTIVNINGYIKYFGYSDEKWDWLLFTSKTGDGATTSVPIGDYTYATANLNGHRLVYLGGYWTTTSNSGGYCWQFAYGSGRARSIGCRLEYLPSA